ncbi:MAG: cyclase family protein [Myxococcota bacterium]|jgi:arylformamidase|nr:cyclase family protein [Myxococcota bacterium]
MKATQAVLFDVSLPLSAELPVYPGDPTFLLEPLSVADERDPDAFALSKFSMGTHTGTHVDAPRHFFPEAASIEQMPLELLYGPARLIDLRRAPARLDASVFQALALPPELRLVVKTGRDDAHLTGEAARYLRWELGVRLFGIDSSSVDPSPQPWLGYGFPAHRQLLGGDEPCWIIEGMALSGLCDGPYRLICCPLPLRGADAAPARVLMQRG